MTQAQAERASPAVFLDRDGTIMHDIDYCSDPNAIELFDGVIDALRSLKEAGFKLFVITNQSGIGRGYFSEREYRAVESELNRRLGPELIDATYFCPDEPGKNSRRRKPAPEMVLEAARDHNLDLGRSFFIGDKAIDIDCGRDAGVRTVLVRAGYGHSQECVPDWTVENLSAAAEIVLKQRR